VVECVWKRWAAAEARATSTIGAHAFELAEFGLVLAIHPTATAKIGQSCPLLALGPGRALWAKL